jgi:predicted glycogen debranching enzyme
MIQFGQEICGNLESALTREWLEMNELGGFASSTIVGLNSRRYHGLLTAATKPPVGRLVLFSKLEETLILDGRPYELSANRYPGVVHPQGHQYLKRFRLDPFPVFTYAIDGLELEKSVSMVQGENTTIIVYKLAGYLGGSIQLEVRPLIAYRDYHSTTHENGALNAAVQTAAGLATLEPYRGLPALHIAHNANALEDLGGWYRNFVYDAERERGLDFVEDLFNPFVLWFDLRDGAHAAIIASTERHDIASVAALR